MAKIMFNCIARTGALTAVMVICLTAAWSQTTGSDTLTPEQEKAEANKIIPEIGATTKPRATAKPAESTPAPATSATLAAATPAPEVSADKSTQTIVLMGERVGLHDLDSHKGPFVDLLGLTTSTLGGKVIDRTTHSQLLSETVIRVDSIKALKPDVVIVFTGYSDEKAKTTGEKMRSEAAKLVNRLKATGARVVLVPAAPNVGALTGAYLRLTATDLGATYVSMGTEVSGRPFEDAFEGIKVELTGAAPEAAPPAPEPAKSVTISGGKIVEPSAAEATPEISVASEKARLDRELSRVAGTDEVPTREELNAMPGQNASANVAANDDATTIPTGNVITKRGKDAKESISMRPLPAVKAFRPSIPVPRLNIEKKEPGLSR